MDRSNLDYVDSIYQSYQKDPKSVADEWRFFFQGMEFGLDKSPQDSQLQAGSTPSSTLNQDEIKVMQLIDAYRHYGHLKADLDPLKLLERKGDQLELKKHGLSEKDLDKKFQATSIIGLKDVTLKQAVEHLNKIYCQTLAVQVQDAFPEKRDWFYKEFESQSTAQLLTSELKKKIFQQLTRTESLEKFFHTRFVAQKRFSIEGADAMIPMLEYLVDAGTGVGVEEIVIGMAHRGRINVLANFMEKGLDIILAEFTGMGIPDTEIEVNDGDVKYHMGYSTDKQTATGPCHVSLAFNPSHLEAVNPVVCGMARAKQRRRKDTKERRKVIPVLIHGDAAFAGQGVVLETLQLSEVPGYTVGGTIHIVVDNQVGFTTSPDVARSNYYSSDTAKVLSTPVLHVNADDPEACVQAMDIALRFRQQYRQDIVIHMVCYRKYGHNEGDEPAFTQPVMYGVIKSHPTVREIYSKKLVESKVIESTYVDSFFQEKIDNLQKVLDKVKSKPPVLKPIAFEGLWKGLRRSRRDDFSQTVDTSVDRQTLKEVAKALVTVPESFSAHPKLLKLLEARDKMVFETELVDWGMAELLAYGTLLKENISVRLSGQDVARGTFTHRHCNYFDTKSNAVYNPFEQLSSTHEFCVYNSVLSEYAVLGFEYGNAIVDPTFLTIWEAQFGDFANGAQIIIDQFLSSGESKWQRMCGLVLLLPHGYEGQGPEHSSARLERFLQLCAQDNMQVCNLTTPAQIFHALRRQVKREFRKPLVVMSPKSLLRHPRAISTLDSLTQGHFMDVIDDVHVKDRKTVETLVLCSGKIYFELEEYKEQKPDYQKKFAVARLEQIYPFPDSFLLPILQSYPNLKRVVWAQEEPKNMGAWMMVSTKLRSLLAQQKGVLSDLPLQYVGRTDRASPATGSTKTHAVEQNEIITTIFSF